MSFSRRYGHRKGRGASRGPGRLRLLLAAGLLLTVLAGTASAQTANCSTYGFASDGYAVGSVVSYKAVRAAGWETAPDSSNTGIDDSDNGTATNDCKLETSGGSNKLKIKDKGTGGSNYLRVNTAIGAGVATGTVKLRLYGSDDSDKLDGSCKGKQMWTDFQSITVYNYAADGDNVVTGTELSFTPGSVLVASGNTPFGGCPYEAIELDVTSLYTSMPGSTFIVRIVAEDGATDNTEITQVAEVYVQYTACQVNGTITVTGAPQTGTTVDLTTMVTASGATPDTYTVRTLSGGLVWTGTPAEAAAVDASGWATATYELTVDGTDDVCGLPVSGVDNFDYTACTETASVTLDPLPDPITEAVAITATVSGGGTNAEVSPDNVNWYPSGWVYTPPENTTTEQQFLARATGVCGGIVHDARGWQTANVDTTVPYCYVSSCGGCHAYPPRDSTGGRGVPDGSVVGSHQVHKSSACTTCHIDNGTNNNHKNDLIEMAASISGGSYGKGTSFPVSTNPTLDSCANTSCHYAASPVWGSTGGLACDGCHGYPPIAAGVDHSGSDGGVTLMQQHADCYICHLTEDDGTGAHDPYPTYDPATNHANGSITMNATAGYNSTNGGCDAACHPNDAAHQLAVSGLPVENLAGPAGCEGCHGYPPITKHAKGATPVDHSGSDGGATLLAEHDDCVVCHGDKDDGTGRHAPHSNFDVAINHNNGYITMNGPNAAHGTPAGTEYDESTYGCDAACHANDAAHQLSNSGLVVEYGDFGGAGGPCDNCHTTTQGARRAVFSDFSQASRHVFGGTVTNWDCIVCHAEGDENATGQAGNDSTYHMNGVVDMRDVDDVGAGDTTYTWSGALTDAEHTNMDTFCLSCHDADGASTIAVVGNGSGVTTSPSSAEALGPFNDTDGIGTGGVAASGPVNITDSPSSGTLTTDDTLKGRTRVVDVKSQFDPANESHHAVLAPRYNSVSGQITTWQNVTLKSGQQLQTVQETARLHCADCHTVDVNAHGSATPWMLTAAGTGSPNNSPIDNTCFQCHSSNYFGGAVGRWDHSDDGSNPWAWRYKAGNPLNLEGGPSFWGSYATSYTDKSASNSNEDLSYCLNCHGGGNGAEAAASMYGGIHGLAGTDARGNTQRYRFMGGAYLAVNPGGNNDWTNQNATVTCYASSSANRWATCAKHDNSQGDKGWTYTGNRGTSY